jgi:4-hydroxyphenylpyruvate dioxygenase-like putative hemolysin
MFLNCCLPKGEEGMRKAIDHVSHVVFCVRPDELDDAKSFWDALGVELEEFTREDYGLRILYGWNSGVEVITSVGSTGGFVEAISAHLEQHGPGVYSVVYGVPSLVDAVDRVRRAGADALIFEEPMRGDEPWFDRYEVLREGAVSGMDALRLALVEKRHRVEIESQSGAVSHVIYAIEHKNIEVNVKFLKDALGVDFEKIDTGNPDLEILYSGAAGLELLSPAPQAEGAVAEGWREHGDGPLMVAFQVPDIEVAVGKAEAFTGKPPARRISYTGLPGWSDRYTVLEEAILEPFCGMHIVLAQMDLVGDE